MNLVSRKYCSPSWMPSRPSPDCLYPPNLTPKSVRIALCPTVPDRSRAPTERAEDLLLSDDGVVVDVAEHGRLDVPAAVEVLRAAAAGGQRRAVGDPLGDVALGPVPLPLRRQRPHLGGVTKRVTNPHLTKRGRQGLEHVVMTGPWHHDP